MSGPPAWLADKAAEVAADLARVGGEVWGTEAMHRQVMVKVTKRWHRVRNTLMALAVLVCAAGWLGAWSLLWLVPLLMAGAIYESIVASMMAEVARIHAKAMQDRP